jgi:methionyl-tRNA formyltransferase
VVVDNPSWVLPFAETLVARINEGGDRAALCRNHDAIAKGSVAFYLGCVKITPSAVLARNRKNIIVHASDLPKGKGFSPLTWQILNGFNEIPVCLFEAVEAVDAGPVVYREKLRYEGHELIDELRDVLGRAQTDLCLRYLAEVEPPEGTVQSGEGSIYNRRQMEDSRLDPHRSLAEQFDLLRTVDNDKYPAFFDLRGHRYRIAIEKMDEEEG